MKKFQFSLAIIVAIISFDSFHSRNVRAQSTVQPELPRVFLSTAYPNSSGATLNVSAGGNLQTAIDSAQPGDTIVLQAGAVFTGNFILRAKTGSDWIIIRTSNLAGISIEGTRISATQASAMPKILSPNTMPALATASGAHHYRLVGLEIGIATNVGTNYGIVCLGDVSQSSLSAVPHNLVIDRCYIHGNQTGDVSRGVALNSASTAIIDSNISNCHGVGFDTQAIAGWSGPGPFKIVNNYLEAAGENVLFGGADPRIANLVPSDIEFRRNHCVKPLSWQPSHPSYAGIHWSVKNLFELKNAQRVLIDGNLFENCWVDAQTGFIIVFTPRNQDGTAPWSVVQDVTFTNNICRHAAAGIQFLGVDNIFPSQRERRIKVKNNLFHDIGGSVWGGNGRLFQMLEGTEDVHIDHNTALQTSNILSAEGTAHTGFVFTNNITPHNDYGVIGAGRSIGNDSLNFFFPGNYFSKNVIVAGPSQVYPSGNFFPASLNDVQFVDQSNFNYRLSSTSPYRNAGTDGLDIGANHDAIAAAIGGSSPPPTPNQAPQVSITASATSGTAPVEIEFAAVASDADGTIASFVWEFGDGQTSSLPLVSHSYRTAGNFNARVTVTDNLGATGTASVAIVVTALPLPSGSEVVLHASAAVRVGRWERYADFTAAGTAGLLNPDAAAAKLTAPLSNPADYFEMSFYAVAGYPYRLWMRGKAQNDSPYNDSVFIQFSGSVNAAGDSVFRIGTTDATTFNLEDCSGCGLQGWGWQDNGWGVGVMGPVIYFANTGPQTLRVQVREDGLMIDQIVLSPQIYLDSSPGTLKNDTTILPERSGLSVTTITGVMPNSGTVSGGTSLIINGNGFTSGASVMIGGVAATSVLVESPTTISALTPVHSAGAVDVIVTNANGSNATLLAGYTYLGSNQAPQVTISASATSGLAPISISLTADASDSDGSIATYLWDFGDGQTSTLATTSHVYQTAGAFIARVSVTDNLGATATASVTINVTAPTLAVRVLYPNGGEAFVFNTTCNVSWLVTGGTAVRQDIYISLNGGATWSVLASGLSGTENNFSWHVPKTATATARIKVRAWNAGGAYFEDASDRDFTIQRRAR